MIFASGGDRPAAVSQREAEMLFRLKDATLGQPHAPEWQRLFVQGVGNYLQGWTGGHAISRDRAARLETFMNDTSSGLGRFFERMTRLGARDLGAAAQDMLSGGKPPRDYAGEAEAEAALSSPEKAWIDGRIKADGRIDPLEEALLAFLAEG
jgi:hypothetical protein